MCSLRYILKLRKASNKWNKDESIEGSDITVANPPSRQGVEESANSQCHHKSPPTSSGLREPNSRLLSIRPAEILPSMNTPLKPVNGGGKISLGVLERFAPLYSHSVVAKIWGVASRALQYNSPPTKFPEYTKPGGTEYLYTDADFWTSGFFPGNLLTLLERQRKWPHIFPSRSCTSTFTNSQPIPLPHPLKLQYACQWWTTNLHEEAARTDTHDLGFMIQPWARKAWELNQDPQALAALITAAHSLASRFDQTFGAIRSWDTCHTRQYAFDDPQKDFLVIIDSMMNIDLLFWVAAHTSNPHLERVARTHAHTVAEHHIRSDNSTFHVVNFGPQPEVASSENGRHYDAEKTKSHGNHTKRKVVECFTNQGYSNESCWSRGQAWAVMGFTQTYLWTRDEFFLNVATRCAQYFLSRLPADGVPYWDFDAPLPGPRDTSAAMVMVYALLHLYEIESMRAVEQPGCLPSASHWLESALQILDAVLDMSLSPAASFLPPEDDTAVDGIDMGGFDSILMNATINNYEFAPRVMADHGLVYADYFFLLVGNKLLELRLA